MRDEPPTVEASAAFPFGQEYVVEVDVAAEALAETLAFSSAALASRLGTHAGPTRGSADDARGEAGRETPYAPFEGSAPDADGDRRPRNGSALESRRETSRRGVVASGEAERAQDGGRGRAADVSEGGEGAGGTSARGGTMGANAAAGGEGPNAPSSAGATAFAAAGDDETGSPSPLDYGADPAASPSAPRPSPAPSRAGPAPHSPSSSPPQTARRSIDPTLLSAMASPGPLVQTARPGELSEDPSRALPPGAPSMRPSVASHEATVVGALRASAPFASDESGTSTPFVSRSPATATTPPPLGGAASPQSPASASISATRALAETPNPREASPTASDRFGGVEPVAATPPERAQTRLSLRGTPPPLHSPSVPSRASAVSSPIPPQAPSLRPRGASSLRPPAAGAMARRPRQPPPPASGAGGSPAGTPPARGDGHVAAGARRVLGARASSALLREAGALKARAEVRRRELAAREAARSEHLAEIDRASAELSAHRKRLEAAAAQARRLAAAAAADAAAAAAERRRAEADESAAADALRKGRVEFARLEEISSECDKAAAFLDTLERPGRAAARNRRRWKRYAAREDAYARRRGRAALEVERALRLQTDAADALTNARTAQAAQRASEDGVRAAAWIERAKEKLVALDVRGPPARSPSPPPRASLNGDPALVVAALRDRDRAATATAVAMVEACGRAQEMETRARLAQVREREAAEQLERELAAREKRIGPKPPRESNAKGRKAGERVGKQDGDDGSGAFDAAAPIASGALAVSAGAAVGSTATLVPPPAPKVAAALGLDATGKPAGGPSERDGGDRSRFGASTAVAARRATVAAQARARSLGSEARQRSKGASHVGGAAAASAPHPSASAAALPLRRDGRRSAASSASEAPQQLACRAALEAARSLPGGGSDALLSPLEAVARLEEAVEDALRACQLSSEFRKAAAVAELAASRAARAAAREDRLKRLAEKKEGRQ